MFNRTHLEHTLFAVVVQVMITAVYALVGFAKGVDLSAWLIWGSSAGAIAAVLMLFGREYAQVEYRVRQQTGRSLTDMMPWHVLRPSLWTRDGVLDVLVPAVFVWLIALDVWWRFGGVQ